MKRTDCEVFVPITGLNGNLSEKQKKKYRTIFRSRDEDCVFRYVLDGTTFSGHPTKTTLGNTLRSILYTSFFCKAAGVECKFLAAGDDVTAWVRKEHT